MVKLPIVEKIHPQSDMFAMGLQNKGTGDSKLYQSPGLKVTHKGPQVILGHDLKEFSKRTLLARSVHSANDKTAFIYKSYIMKIPEF